VLRNPAWVSDDLTINGRLTIVFQQCDAVDPRIIIITRLSSFICLITAYLSLCLHLTDAVTGTGPRLDSWWVVSPCQGESLTH
jgi:hypothetical protein